LPEVVEVEGRRDGCVGTSDEEGDADPNVNPANKPPPLLTGLATAAGEAGGGISSESKS